VQVMLFSNRLEVWNPGWLPPPLTPKALRAPHASIPHNPLIAEPLFLTRYIEKAGTGILDMIKLCKAAGVPTPQFRQDGGQFVQTLRRPPAVATAPVTAQVRDRDNTLIQQSIIELSGAMGLTAAQVTAQVTAQVEKVLVAASSEPMSREELQMAAGIKHREHFRKTYIEPLVSSGWLERTIPDKPTSSLQKYRLTEKGRFWLAGRKP
jgi:ATP-dependent DNA helicase RecG